MMVGLLAVGASAADYTDQDKITAAEAVNLLTALGVFEGYPGGAFDPTKALTRAEGAKIIALLLGANVTGLKSSFSDMGGHWADGFVAYCASIGIIAGYGDGRFGPDDPLTYAQFAKMLLCALGYDATREQLTGAEWEIGVAKLVNQVNLAKQVPDFNYSATINRNDTAQMAFNTLLTPMVGYNGNGIAVAGGNLATPREYLANAAYDYRADFGELEDYDLVWTGTQWIDAEANDFTDGLMEFIENYFPNFKLERDEDDWGFNSHIWFKGKDRSDTTYNESKEVTSSLADVIMATYTTDVALVSRDTLFKDAQFTKAMSGITPLFIKENGHLLREGTGSQSRYTVVYPTRGDTLPGALANYPGATVYLIDTEGNDGIGDTLIVKYPMLAKVTGVVKAEDSATKERQVELDIYYVTEGTITVNEQPVAADKYATRAATFETDTFSKKEYVLVYPDMTITQAYAAAANPRATFPIIEVTTVDSTIGTLGKVGKDTIVHVGDVNALTVDGVRYSVGAQLLSALGPDSLTVYEKHTEYNLNAEITLYTANGYVLGVNAAAVPYTDYVFVVGVSAQSTQDLITGKYSWTVAYAKQDGTTETTTVTTAANERPTDILKQWAIVTPRGNAATFTTVDTTPKTIKGLYPDTPVLRNGTNDANGIATSGKTNFVILSGSRATTVKAYTGIANVPTFGKKLDSDPTGTAYALYDKQGNTAAVFIDFATADANATTGTALYFTTSTPSGTVKDATTTYYTFDVINTKGEVSTVNVSQSVVDGTSTTAPSFYGAGLYIPETNASGVITALSVPTVAGGYPLTKGVRGDITAGDDVVTVSGGFGSSTFGVTSSVTIYRYAGGKVTTIELDDLNGKYGDIAAITANPLTASVATIFFVPQAKPTV
jgi:hypothetical protein